MLHGQLDLEKVRKLSLTEKQEQMATKLEQKVKKLRNVQREQNKGAEDTANRKRKQERAEFEFEAPEDSGGGGGGNMEKAAKMEEKVDKLDSEINLQTDNLLLSLGLRKEGTSGKTSKRRAAMYDTHDIDGEDDFFDRATSTQSKAKSSAPKGKEEASSELRGLPALDKVENKASLESKVGLLNAERVQLVAQLATETAKARQRAAAAGTYDGEEDALDAFMSRTLEESVILSNSIERKRDYERT